MDSIIVGLIAGAIIAIAGFLLFEFGDDEFDTVPGYLSHRQQVGIGLMVGSVLVWLLTALIAATDASGAVGVALVGLGVVLALLLGIWAGRISTEHIPLVESAPMQFTESAYERWPNQLSVNHLTDSEVVATSKTAEEPIANAAADVERTAEAEVPAAIAAEIKEEPGDLQVNDAAEVDSASGDYIGENAVPTLEPAEGEVEATIPTDIADYESPLLSGIDPDSHPDDGSFVSSLLSDLGSPPIASPRVRTSGISRFTRRTVKREN